MEKFSGREKTVFVHEHPCSSPLGSSATKESKKNSCIIIVLLNSAASDVVIFYASMICRPCIVGFNATMRGSCYSIEPLLLHITGRGMWLVGAWEHGWATTIGGAWSTRWGVWPVNITTLRLLWKLLAAGRRDIYEPGRLLTFKNWSPSRDSQPFSGELCRDGSFVSFQYSFRHVEIY